MSVGNVSAHEALLEAVRGIRATVEGVLRGMDGSAKKVVAKGVYVGAFNYLELFIWDRWRELCAVINHNSSYRFVDLSPDLQRRALRKQIVYLSKRKFKGTELKDLTYSLYDLLCALNNASQSLLSEELFRPDGSNISEGGLRDSFALISIQMNKLFKQLGRQFVKEYSPESTEIIPLESFRSLEDFRHEAAHNPSFSMQSLLANEIVQNMLMFALCFDLAVSTFALKVIRACDQQSKSLVSFTDDDFVNWRAVIISRDKGQLSVFRFNQQLSELSKMRQETSREIHIECDELLANLDLPLSHRVKYPGSASELSESAAADLLREPYVQNGIAELLEQFDSDYSTCAYSVYFDNEYNILDWRLERALMVV